jgi:hypothetical protein
VCRFALYLKEKGTFGCGEDMKKGGKEKMGKDLHYITYRNRKLSCNCGQEQTAADS